MTENYNSSYTGEEIDRAVGIALNLSDGGSTAAADVSFDNTDSGIAASNAQTALDEALRRVNGFYASHTEFNADGSITETDGNGNVIQTVFTSDTVTEQTYTTSGGKSYKVTTTVDSTGNVIEQTVTELQSGTN